ncbi:MAG: cupin domain-containing protein [Oscillatoriales cyanobacterium C42_A2020_001]|nr:cupin domain-containing protein [Leptolyngbyaceae cyanobacterium C42_A2020_001]
MKNIFQNLPQQLDAEVFEILVRHETVKIERIVSKGHTSPQSGWYDQEQNEWVIVLQGEAIILFEHGEPMRLTAGSYLNIPSHQKHRVDWTDPTQATIWLAVHY